MANLHGLLAELGLTTPEMHPERDVSHDSEWVVDQPFMPESGKCYELAYGKVMLHGREISVRARIRADGGAPSQWVDLDEGRTLDPSLQALPVRAYRPISEPPASPPSQH